jgi:oligoendopeptidase F
MMSNDTDKMRWDLESVFPGGSGSKELEAFRKAVVDDIEKAKARLSKLPRKLDQDTREEWVNILLLVQDTDKRLDHAGSFTYCLAAQDVTDDRAMVILEEISSDEAAIEVIKTDIDEFAIAVDDAAWEAFVRDKRLVGSAFYWSERRRKARLKMEPKLEKLATELAVSGYHAWNRLYTKMAGDLRSEFVEGGESEELSMGQLTNKMSSPDRDIRRQAFENLESSWRSTEGLAAMQINSLAGFRLSLYKARGWESPLFESYLMARVSEETINTMWSVIDSSIDRIKEYIAAKKRLLGLDSFRWYDQWAPVGRVEKKFTYDQASDFVVTHLSSFSSEMGDFARRAIDDRWIEAEDRSGKMAGGFCTGLPVVRQSRIFMTFSGNYSEMMTLAHEIGHAYHSWVFRDRDYYARYYTMTLAETASTFNEMLVTDAALASAETNAEKLSLVDKKIQEHIAMFCNIRCRFLFETRFYEERKKGPVAKERLNELMVEAQKTAFGGTLADDGYHPLFWASKLHFSETSVPFYNYPYTFGHLFAGGIYDRAKKEGPAFAEKYTALLADTGSMSCEGIARKHLNVDLTGEEFWKDAVGRAVDDIDLFIRLAKDM